jgi:hypothetical protein
VNHLRLRHPSLVLAALLTGCAAAPTGIKGEVTLDGQPVGPGNIVFQPEPGSDSRKASAAIEDGKYSIPAERAPAPGTFKVEVRWSKKTGRSVPSADPGIMMDETFEAIPAKYNDSTTLTVEIKPGASVYDFHLKSK